MEADSGVDPWSTAWVALQPCTLTFSCSPIYSKTAQFQRCGKIHLASAPDLDLVTGPAGTCTDSTGTGAPAAEACTKSASTSRLTLRRFFLSVCGGVATAIACSGPAAVVHGFASGSSSTSAAGFAELPVLFLLPCARM